MYASPAIQASGLARYLSFIIDEVKLETLYRVPYAAQNQQGSDTSQRDTQAAKAEEGFEES